jgi:putative hemolysin
MLEPDSLSLASANEWHIMFHPLSMGTVIGIVVVVILLIFSAMISGAEVAFFSLSPTDKENLKDPKEKSYQLIRGHLELPERLLATILVSNNFVNVGIVIISTYITHSLIDFSEAQVVGFIFEVVAITFALLLFGEILPKIYASNNAIAFARLMARPLSILSTLFYPLSATLIKSTSLVNKRLMRHKHNNISINDISQALELTSDEEFSEDKTILEGIVKFGNTSADQIMTPRIDVIAVDLLTPLDKLIDLINVNGYSRIPVYTESFDNVKGILYIKDLLPHFNHGDSFRWQTLIRPPYFVPENKKIDNLLQEFQKNKVHMAIVVDEYGGTSGIITLEDVLEEIVGDIIDEFDDDDRLFTRIDDSTYVFDGKTQLNDFYRICELDDNFFDEVKGEADTLAGLILEKKGEFPTPNEKISFNDIEFTIELMDKRRIKKIKVAFIR